MFRADRADSPEGLERVARGDEYLIAGDVEERIKVLENAIFRIALGQIAEKLGGKREASRDDGAGGRV